ncbi:hypothetical protein CULT_2530002 [[Clostridium] ultunense Esp]|nr:hypothetical protein CULT_2530002 [[Clostridium] ultunense Esp]
MYNYDNAVCLNIKAKEPKSMVICLKTDMHLKFDDTREYYYSCY